MVETTEADATPLNKSKSLHVLLPVTTGGRCLRHHSCQFWHKGGLEAVGRGTLNADWHLKAGCSRGCWRERKRTLAVHAVQLMWDVNIVLTVTSSPVLSVPLPFLQDTKEISRHKNISTALRRVNLRALSVIHRLTC